MKSCCITGHRVIPKEKVAFVEQELQKEIVAALDDGFRCFISGFADGVDLLFAELVMDYRDNYKEYSDIFLEAALPHPGWSSKGAKYNLLLSRCNGIGVHSPKYHIDCFLIRNRYMVSTCERVIAVYDGREKGGTVQTIRYAATLGCDIRKIDI